MGRKKELHGITVNQVHHALLDLKGQMDQTPYGLMKDDDEFNKFSHAYTLIDQAAHQTESAHT